MRLKISARASHLARLQAYQVGETLKKNFDSLEIEYFFRESLGDKNLTDPLWRMPEKGVFTEDFYQDLVQEKTDLVVHSWKDLPTERNSDTLICGTLPRADQRDLLLFKKESIEKLKCDKKVRLLSSSQRRIYNLEKFLLGALPHQPTEIIFKDVRGNIPTRIEKLFSDSEVDGLILAKAALDRLLSINHPDFKALQIKLRTWLSELEFMVLPLSENPNAAAQGALAIEVKKGRDEIISLVEKVNHQATFESVQKEREILSGYGGGCHQKIGIAVLKRDYGDVHFLKGLTDQGETLDQQKIFPSTNFPALGSRKCNISSIKNLFERKEIPFQLPSEANAFFISRVSAYREVKGVVWAAGLETWKKLALKNVWVHGSSEALGEGEDARVDILVGGCLSWIKLTHKDAGLRASQMKSVATYELKMKFDLPEEALQAENFFWMSAYQFEQITSRYPQLLQKNHCCGVGLTYQALCEKLAPLGKKPYLFLNEWQWRQHE